MREPPPRAERKGAGTLTIMSRAADLKMDDPGRIKIPEELLASVGIADKMVFVGALESFQIWSPEAYAAYEADMAAAVCDPDVISALAAPYDATIAAGGVPGLTLVQGDD
ncbi:MAG: division/cell wall cluster transcriptional repressor MraZ [Pseudomonadota bacterium]